MYLHERDDWTAFTWDEAILLPLVSDARYAQGLFLGKMQSLGFLLQDEAELDSLTLETLESSQIEGETLNAREVRSSVARRLGLDQYDEVPTTAKTDGVVDMTLDATRHFDAPLTAERLFGWHAALFTTGFSGLHRIQVGAYRQGGMQVVSGAIGRERIHYEAPVAERVAAEMDVFIHWFNSDTTIDPLIKAGLAHLWFVSIHPFDDGNGRMARAISELQLVRSDRVPRRFYSMSAQIRKDCKGYYAVLELTQKGFQDVTAWLHWFLLTLHGAIGASEQTLESVLVKAAFYKHLEGVVLNKRQHFMLERLLGDFKGNLTTVKWAKMTKTSHDTALRDIKDLFEKNVLVQDTKGGKSTSYRLMR